MYTQLQTRIIIKHNVLWLYDKNDSFCIVGGGGFAIGKPPPPTLILYRFCTYFVYNITILFLFLRTILIQNMYKIVLHIQKCIQNTYNICTKLLICKTCFVYVLYRSYDKNIPFCIVGGGGFAIGKPPPPTSILYEF